MRELVRVSSAAIAVDIGLLLHRDPSLDGEGCHFATIGRRLGRGCANLSAATSMRFIDRRGRMFDLLLNGGRVIDPAQNIDEVLDVAFADGKVAAIGQDLGEAARESAMSRARSLRPGPDRPAHPCLLGRHVARRRSRRLRARQRLHHADRRGLGRPGQHPRLPQARDRAGGSPHPAVPEHLLRRHLRPALGPQRRRMHGSAPAELPRLPRGRRASRPIWWSASRCASAAAHRARSASCRCRSRSRSPNTPACR